MPKCKTKKNQTITLINKNLKSAPNWLNNLPPRENLLTNGAEKLSDIELLAIILSTGTKGMDVIQFSNYLLTQFKSLHGLIMANSDDLNTTKGIGPAKFAMIKAIGEISKRYMLTELEQGDIMSNSLTTKRYLRVLLSKYECEVFVVLFLDNQNRVLNYKKMFVGTVNTVTVYPRDIAREALKRNATSIILAHNHPSGNPHPSNADLVLTQKITAVCEICNINVIDHVIISRNHETSLAELGFLST